MGSDVGSDEGSCAFPGRGHCFSIVTSRCAHANAHACGSSAELEPVAYLYRGTWGMWGAEMWERRGVVRG